MNYRNLFFAVLMLFPLSTGLACINEYRTLLSGRVVMTDEPGWIPTGRQLDQKELLRELSALDKLYKQNNLIETLSDYGAVLIFLGRHEEAITIYRSIEKQRPGLYSTAANIGTAFELTGDVDSALFYIDKAMRINPDSHEGSEWIHLRILEMKKRIKEHTGSFASASILGLDFGSDGKPVNVNKYDLQQLERQMKFQLDERMTFVKSPDRIVGEVLFDLGNVMALTTDVETALECYAAAKEYGFSSSLMEKRISTMKKLSTRTDIVSSAEDHVKRSPWSALGVILAVIASAWFVMKLLRRRARQKNRTENQAFDDAGFENKSSAGK